MCRYFVLFNKVSYFPKWAYLSTIGYKRHCASGILSTGVVEINKQGMYVKKYIPPPMCLDDMIHAEPDTKIAFYHLRIPFDRSTHSIAIENVHPFIFDDRFICMHNGLIEYKPNYEKIILKKYKEQIYGTTDSELFFALWLSLAATLKDMERAFHEACKYTLPNSSMNIVLYDKKLNNLYIYRSKVANKLVPPVYVSDYGFANFKIPNSKTIQKDKLLLISPTIT
jgi:hypothetical protein